MSKRDVIIFGLIIVFCLAIGGIFYWALQTNKIKPQASEIVLEAGKGTKIALKSGSQGNLVSFPYTKPQVSGLSSEDKIFVYKDGEWEEASADAFSAGPAFLIKVNSDENIYVKGNPSGPTLIALSEGDNYIGNPYPYPVKLENVRISYKENDRYVSKTLLELVDEESINYLSYFDNSTANFTNLEINNDQTLLPYKGYKINCSKDDMALGFKK